MRNYESLPEYQNDIDILVERGNTYDLINRLKLKFKKEGGLFLYSARFSGVAVYFYDTLSDQFIHIDITEEIKWGIFEYISSNEVLNTRIKYNKFYIPNHFYEMQELLLTRLVYQGKIKEVYKYKITQLYKSMNKSLSLNDKYDVFENISTNK